MPERNFSSYQLVHLMKIRSNGLNSLLITDGVGVGKTISAGYILYYCANILREPSLIVCPPILVDKWRYELKHRFGLDSRLATNMEGFELMWDEINSGVEWDVAPIYLCSFSLLSREKEMQIPYNGMRESPLGLILFDEVHYVRNPKTNAYVNARNLAFNAQYKVGLSATPINNSLEDLAGIISVLHPRIDFEDANDLFGDLWQSPTLDPFSGMVTRFLKEQISDQFTTRNLHTEVIEYPEEYMQFVNHIVESRASGESSFFEKIIYYRLASSSPRAFLRSFSESEEEYYFPDPKLNRLSELLSAKSEERWLIFTEFKETARHIEESIEDRIVMVLSGESNFEERQAIVNIFRNEPNSVLVMTPVGSEGLDFQICSNLVNYDLHWNPMKIEQRIGRIDRIGQAKSEIDIHNFVARGSIDEMVVQKIGEKLALVSDTFAEIMSIIANEQSPNSMLDNDVLDSELEAAEELLNASKFYNRFTSSDIDVIKNINPENCDVEEWLWLDWTHPTPWIGNCNSWLTQTLDNATEFNTIISAYAGSNS